MGQRGEIEPSRTKGPWRRGKTTPPEANRRCEASGSAWERRPRRWAAAGSTGPQERRLSAAGVSAKEKAGVEGAGGPGGSPHNVFLSPHPTAGSSGGAGGVPAGGEPPAPAEPAAWAGAEWETWAGLSLPASAPGPAPPALAGLARRPLGWSSCTLDLITKQNYFRFPCLPGAGTEEVEGVSNGERVRLGRWKVLGDEAGDGWYVGGRAMGEGAEMGDRVCGTL